MRLNTTQQLRLEQQMRLSPRIIQAMEILQLPMIALQERIESELQSNPVLEYREGNGEDAAPAPAADEESAPRGEQDLVVDNSNEHARDFERLAEFEDEYEPWAAAGDDAPAPRTPSGERDKKLDAMANAPAPEQSLVDYLMEQWAFIDASADVKSAGEAIINHIDDDGYLRTDLGQIAQSLTPPAGGGVMQQALTLVQALDPIGVAATNLKECLLLQLRAEAASGRDVSLETLLVERFGRDIELNRLPYIAKRTGKSLDEIKKALEELSHLNPRPGHLIGHRPAPTIQPEVLVELDENGEVVVTMANDHWPRLGISRSYRKLAGERSTDRDARQFLRKNILSAQWLLSAIQQRRETIRRVAEEVFKAQKDFLLHGQEALHPLPMNDVARKVGVHVATVSRAVAGKHVQTSWGIFPLRMFFSGGTKTEDGQDMSWDAVKARLKELVDAEDKAHPLDDETLAAEMRKHGITIARRTVAKYRETMDIPPARKRKQY